MRPIVTHVAWFVCLSVCLLVTSVSRAKTDEPIEKPFGDVDSWAQGTRWGPDPTTERDTLGEDNT